MRIIKADLITLVEISYKDGTRNAFNIAQIVSLYQFQKIVKLVLANKEQLTWTCSTEQEAKTTYEEILKVLTQDANPDATCKTTFNDTSSTARTSESIIPRSFDIK